MNSAAVPPLPTLLPFSQPPLDARSQRQLVAATARDDCRQIFFRASLHRLTETPLASSSLSTSTSHPHPSVSMRLLTILVLLHLRGPTRASAWSATDMYKAAMQTDLGLACAQPGVQCLM